MQAISLKDVHIPDNGEGASLLREGVDAVGAVAAVSASRGIVCRCGFVAYTFLFVAQMLGQTGKWAVGRATTTKGRDG